MLYFSLTLNDVAPKITFAALMNRMVVFSFKRLAFTLFSVLLISGSAIAQHEFCGTRSLPDSTYRRLRTITKKISQTNTFQKNDDPICLPVQIFILAQPTNLDFVSEDDINGMMSHLNHQFNDAGVSFYLKQAPTVYPHEEYSVGLSSTLPWLVDAAIDFVDSPFDAINIYIVQQFSLPGLGGFASYPSSDSPTTNAIFLNYEDVTFATGKTAVHEMGHFLSLAHTFTDAGGILELVTREENEANCDIAADGFCDTPADPGDPANNLTITCQYIGTGLDANGDSYSPPVTNAMSYAHWTCMDDNNFTPQQKEAIRAGALLRLSHISYSLDASPEINEAPTLSLQNIEGSNAIFTFNNIDNAYGYLLEVSQQSPTTGFVAVNNTWASSNQNTLAFGGIDPEESYWFRIRATNSGCEAVSNIITISGGLILDADGSSGAELPNYNAGTLCAPSEKSIVDDVEILGNSIGGEYVFMLENELDENQEYLAITDVEGVEINQVSNTELRITNESLSNSAFAEVIQDVRYLHMGEDITSGVRTIKIYRQSDAENITPAITTLAIGKKVSSGDFSNLVSCPAENTVWSSFIPANATPGGTWTDNAGNLVTGTIDQGTTYQNYTYTVGLGACEVQTTGNIAFTNPPNYQVELTNPYCETQCDGHLQVTASSGFELYLDNMYFVGSIYDLCEESFDLLITNNKGCERSENIDVRYKYTNKLEGLPAVMCTASEVYLADMLGLSETALTILDSNTVINPWEPIMLEANRSYQLEIYDLTQCLDRTVSFSTRMCPTENSQLVFIPTAFTPDGDGINDLFKVVSQFEFAQFSLVVYDRFGMEVHRTNDQHVAWNGSNRQSGYAVQDGVYTYVLSYRLPGDTKLHTAKGAVTVLR